ncbi:MAG: hypothetical protein QNJ45_01180 [Ardenticatenaceae bacterium]|nr:hypothetical protein [Ardenticatenaceae bacterium]
MIKKAIFTTLFVAVVLLLFTGVGKAIYRPVEAAGQEPLTPAASSLSYQLEWDVVANGGSTMQSASYTMYSTTGQTAVTTMDGNSYTMENGFWHGVFDDVFQLLLPIIMK